MRRFIVAGLALSALTLALGTTNAQAQSLINGFEAPVLGSGFSYGTVGNAATFTGGSGISGNGSAFTAGNPNAPQGVQVAFLQNLGSFSQNLTLGPGAYNFSFQAAQRGNFQQGTQSFQVFLNAVSLGTFTPGTTAYQTFNTGFVNVTAGSVLTFSGLVPPATGGDRTVFVDNIVATNVAPEPGSALLLVPGLLGLVGVMRRRARK